MLTIGIIGDYDKTYTLHLATDAALNHCATHLRREVSARWLAPKDLVSNLEPLMHADGLICAPGSPYSSLSGALAALRYARENDIPTLGTCGGCQHMIVEYGQNVLGLEAKHAEYEPDAADPIVTPLSCSLVGRTGTVALDSGTNISQLYGLNQVQEQYFCGFGVNTAYQQRLDDSGFNIRGRDAEDQVARIFQLSNHPFYVATLFVPQARSTANEPHPLLLALLRAAAHRAANRSHSHQASV